MIFTLLLGAVCLLCVTALAAALAARWDRVSLALGTSGAVISCLGGTLASIGALVAPSPAVVVSPFDTPLGPLRVGIDSLAAFFLLCVFLVSGLGALYGAGYLRSYIGRRPLAPAAANFNLLIASMAVVVLARDAVLFLMAWEVMSLVSFFLVTYEDERPEVRSAGTAYLIASHAGVVALFLLFVLLGRETGSFDFDLWHKTGNFPAGVANAAFLLALVGFGAKAGFWPIHVWLPVAHPAAPSHVSAVMSGAMIKMGIYGLLRTVGFLGTPPAWWGGLLLAIAGISGVLGVLHALAQHDLKRLLAYHSVENIGIIGMAFGLGLLGQSLGNRVVAFLGYSGSLLHVLNHGLFKGLLFQGAGSVLHATGTREIDQLGGLSRRMPQTSLTFLIGAVAISGLPPLNGFVSEWLIFVGAFRGAAAFSPVGSVAALFVIVALGLIGGLATACFVKAFGVVFLGEPRSTATAHAHEASPLMTGAMWLGAGLCVLIGVAALPVVRFVAPAAAQLARLETPPLEAVGPIGQVSLVAAVLVGLVCGLAFLRKALLRTREVTSSSTWGCGYSQPSARMQYTAASFADLVLEPFGVVFHRSADDEPPRGSFPSHARHEQHLEDRADRTLTSWVLGFAKTLLGVRRIQRGNVQLYLVYVLATLVALLVWQALAGAP